MNSIAFRPAPHQRAAVENTPFSGDFSGRGILSWMLYEREFTRADLRVMGRYCIGDECYRSGLNFESLGKIAEAAGVSTRAVQAANTKFVRRGLIEVNPGLYKGSPVMVRVLRFLPTCQAPPAQDSAPAPSRRPSPAQDLAPDLPLFAPLAQDSAPEDAQDSAPVKGIKNQENNANVSAALATGGGGPQDPTLGPIALAPVPPVPITPPDPAEVDRLIAVVRSRRSDGVRKPAFWALEGCGLLPADLVGLFKSMPAPEPPPIRPSPHPCPAPVETVEALIRSLAMPTADAKAREDRVIDKMVDDFRDAMFRPFFKARVRDVVEGRIDPVAIAKAYAVAKGSTSAQRPGAIFTKDLRRRIGYDGRWKDFAARRITSREARP